MYRHREIFSEGSQKYSPWYISRISIYILNIHFSENIMYKHGEIFAEYSEKNSL